MLWSCSCLRWLCQFFVHCSQVQEDSPWVSSLRFRVLSLSLLCLSHWPIPYCFCQARAGSGNAFRQGFEHVWRPLICSLNITPWSSRLTSLKPFFPHCFKRFNPFCLFSMGFASLSPCRRTRTSDVYPTPPGLSGSFGSAPQTLLSVEKQS